MPTPARGTIPLLALSAVVVLTVVGFAQGLWPANLHNGLLGVSFAVVGVYVLRQRPGHPEGALMLATGVVESVMFCGRQLGHETGAPWWGWLGVWPLSIAIGLTGLTIVCFPDGRLPSPGWRWIVRIGAAVAVVLALVAALWPVGYESAEMTSAFPFVIAEPPVVGPLFEAVSAPTYIAFQILPVVAVVQRWRGSGGTVRRQLAWLGLAAAVVAVVLIVGLAIWQTPRPGILTATLLPVSAGWAILHGQQRATYRALTWAGRSHASGDAATDLVHATADALSSSTAKLWMGDESRLEAVGVWPPAVGYGEPTTLALLLDSPAHEARAVRRGEALLGALSVTRTHADPLSSHESTLLEELAAQATLVLENLGLAGLVSREAAAGHLTELSPREREVLDLMSHGLSNQAIADELFLSIKTVEPVVGSIFTKLGLYADSQTNRRVLAVLAYLRS